MGAAAVGTARQAGTAHLLLAAGVIACAAQTVTVRPSFNFDIAAAVRAKTGREDFTIKHTTQRGSRWFTLVYFGLTRESMVISGAADGSVQFSDYIHSPADRIAIDGRGLIYVRLLTAKPGKTEVQIMNSSLKPAGTQVFSGTHLEPVTSGSDVYWRGGTTLLAAHPSETKLELPAFGPSAPELIEEPYLFLGFQSSAGVRQWIRVGCFSETLTIVDQDGALITAAKLPLDEAYRAAGILPVPPPQSDRESEITRIAWAVVSHDGYLYVCLSSRPVSLPAPIAVIEPLQGRLVRVLAAELPTTPARLSPDDPKGFIYPIAGAVDEALVVTDPGAGVLVVYPIE